MSDVRQKPMRRPSVAAVALARENMIAVLWYVIDFVDGSLQLVSREPKQERLSSSSHIPFDFPTSFEFRRAVSMTPQYGQEWMPYGKASS